MKKQTLIALFSSTALLFGGTLEELVVEAPSLSIPPIQTSLHTSSAHVWRGLDVGDATATTALSAAQEVFGGVTLCVNAEYAKSSTETEEFVSSVSLAKEIEKFMLGLNYTWYSRDFDRSRGAAGEVGFSISREYGGVLCSYTQYLATAGDNESYGEFAALYSTNFGTSQAVDFRGEVGYLADQGVLSHAALKASTDIPVSSAYVVSPFIAYSVALNSAEGIFADTSNLFFGGIEVKTHF